MSRPVKTVWECVAFGVDGKVRVLSTVWTQDQADHWVQFWTDEKWGHAQATAVEQPLDDDEWMRAILKRLAEAGDRLDCEAFDEKMSALQDEARELFALL